MQGLVRFLSLFISKCQHMYNKLISHTTGAKGFTLFCGYLHGDELDVMNGDEIINKLVAWSIRSFKKVHYHTTFIITTSGLYASYVD